MSEIQLRNITKIFEVKGNKRKGIAPEDVYALRDINVTIRDQEFVTIVGPSGCGKSTLLRVIAGLTEQSEGEVILNGRSADALAPGERKVAMVFQEYALYPNRTAFENMAFPLVNEKVEKREIRRFVGQVADMLDIEYLLNRRPKHMSWGQRQRVALGRAICRKPKIMLLDEPLSGADEELRRELRQTIEKVQRTYKMTCLYVTHDLQEAMMMGDRILVMKGGRIMDFDTPERILHDSKERYAHELFEMQQFYVPQFDSATGKLLLSESDEKISY